MATTINVPVEQDQKPSRQRVSIRSVSGYQISLLLWAWVLSSRNLFGPAWLIAGDVVLVLAIGFIVLSNGRRRMAVPREFGWFIGLMAIASISAMANFNDPEFLHTEAYRFFAKMSLYFVGIALAFNVLRNAPPDVFAKCLRVVVWVNALIAMAQQVGHQIGSTIPLFSAYSAGVWDRSTWPRSQGLFSEPSTLSIFVVVAIFAIIQLDQLEIGDPIVAVLTLFMAASVTGAALAVLALVLFLSRRRRRGVKLTTMIGSLVLLVSVVAAGALIEPLRQVLSDRLFSRITDTVGRTGGDRSGAGRVFDSWTVSRAVTDGWTIFGVGPGNMKRRVTELAFNELLDVHPAIIEAGASWVIYTNVLAELGVLGLLVLLALLYRWMSDDIRTMILCLAVGMATGTFTGWPWWCICVVLTVCASRGRRLREGFAREGAVLHARTPIFRRREDPEG